MVHIEIRILLYKNLLEVGAFIHIFILSRKSDFMPSIHSMTNVSFSQILHEQVVECQTFQDHPYIVHMSIFFFNGLYSLIILISQTYRQKTMTIHQQSTGADSPSQKALVTFFFFQSRIIYFKETTSGKKTRNSLNKELQSKKYLHMKS